MNTETDNYDPFSEDHNTENLSEETVHEGGGGSVNIEGRYHVQVESVEYLEADISGGADDDDKKRSLPNFKIQMACLAGEHDSEVGKKIYHRIYMAGWESKQDGVMKKLEEKQVHGILALLHAFGTIGEDAFGKEVFKLNRDMFDRLEQTQAIVKVTPSEFNGKTTQKIAWNNDVWPLTHEKVNDVPMDLEAKACATNGVIDGGDIDDI